MSEPSPRPQAERIAWVDAAKAYGMLLVFYGHFVEALMHQGLPGAFLQFKLVYSFHMPLFFVLAGYVASTRRESLAAFLRRGIATRIVPVLFFNVLSWAILLALAPDWILTHPRYSADGFVSLLLGRPVFNQLTWFLVCLFSVELLHTLVRGRLGDTGRVWLAALGFFAVGWTLCWRMEDVLRVIPIPKNTWYLYEAPVAYAFYLVGVALRRSGWLELSRPAALLAVAACALAVALSFDLNQAPFLGRPEVVMMASSSHGSALWFPLTALVGSFGIIQLARLRPQLPGMLAVGRNTLILLGLNGVMVRAVYPALAGAVSGWLPKHGAAVFGVDAVATAILLAASMPLAWGLRRFVPRLVGYRSA